MDAYPATLVLGAVLLIAARLLSGRRTDFPRGEQRPSILVVKFAGWLLTAAGVLSALQLVMGRGMGLLFWLAALAVLSVAQGRRRHTERNALLWSLALAAESQTSLAAAAESCAQECGGRRARRMHRLAESLRDGVSLPECLRRQPRLVEEAGLVAALAGNDVGALGQALREAAVAGTHHGATRQSLAGKLLLLYWAAWAAIGVATFAPLTVVPELREIFESSSAELPAVTRFILDAYEVAGRWAALLIPLQLALGLALPLYLLLNTLGWTPWRIPPLNRLALRTDAAVVLRALALHAERGRPLPDAIDALAKSHPRPAMRRRLERASADARSGSDWCASLQAGGFARPRDVDAWRSAEREGRLPPALRSTAEGHDRRAVRGLRTALHLGSLAVLAGLGLGVALFVRAVLLPLIEIIGKPG